MQEDERTYAFLLLASPRVAAILRCTATYIECKEKGFTDVASGEEFSRLVNYRLLRTLYSLIEEDNPDCKTATFLDIYIATPKLKLVQELIEACARTGISP